MFDFSYCIFYIYFFEEDTFVKLIVYIKLCWVCKVKIIYFYFITFCVFNDLNDKFKIDETHSFLMKVYFNFLLNFLNKINKIKTKKNIFFIKTRIIVL